METDFKKQQNDEKKTQVTTVTTPVLEKLVKE